MRAGWVVCGRAGVCRREDGCWFASAVRLETGELNGWWSSWPFSVSPSPFPFVFQYPCPRNGGIYASTVMLFLLPACAVLPSGCPQTTDRGVKQIGPGVSIAPGHRKPWHQRRNAKIAGHAGSAAVAAPALCVRGTLASIIRLFPSASIPGPARPRSGLVCQRPAGIPIRDIKFNAPQQAARRRHTRQVPVIEIHDVTSLH